MKNGALARQRICQQHAHGSWDEFNTALKATPPGNNNELGFFFYEQEITPPAEGVHLFVNDDTATSLSNDAAYVRAVVEWQCMALYTHAKLLGMSPSLCLLATGGASSNRQILQVLSNVFGLPVIRGEHSDSAAVGAAYRAIHAHMSSIATNASINKSKEARATDTVQEISPDLDAHAVYLSKLNLFGARERAIIKR